MNSLNLDMKINDVIIIEAQISYYSLTPLVLMIIGKVFNHMTNLDPASSVVLLSLNTLTLSLLQRHVKYRTKLRIR